MLQNAYLLAKIGVDTAENEQHFAEICQKLATTCGPAPDAACAEQAAQSAATRQRMAAPLPVDGSP